MAEYELIDDNTGMSVSVESDRDLTEQDVMATLSEARKQAVQSIETGRYKLNEETQEELGKSEANARLQKLTGYALGIRPEEVDINTGMGRWERAKLSMMPDDGSRMEYLEKKFGDENVKMLDVGGTPKMFYRDPSSKKMTMVDEMGASLADFTSDISGSFAPIAGAVAGAGLVAATGGAAIIPMALGAAAGGFTAGLGQDVAAEVATGQDIELGEKVKKRAVEAAIGIPIDMVTGVGGRILGNAFAKRASLGAIDDLVKSTDELNRAYSADIRLTAAQSADPDASIKQSMRAGLDPKGREAQWYNKQLDELGRIEQTIKSGVASDEPIESVMTRMADKHLRRLETYKQRMNQLDEIQIAEKAKAKKQSASFQRSEKAKMAKQRQLEHDARVNAYNKQFDKMRDSVEKLESRRGREVRSQIARKKQEVEATNNELYKEAYRRTDTRRADTPVSAVSKVIERIDDSQFIPDSPELMALNALKKRIATDQSDLTFRELDSFVRQFGDRVNFKKEHGLKFNEISFNKAYAQLNKLWDTAVGAPKALGARGAGKPARDAHRAARKDFRENVLPYTDGEPARILQMRAGGLSGETLAPEKVLSESLKDSASVKNAIKAGADRDTLKDAYMQSILQSASQSGERGLIKFDRSILNALYRGRTTGIENRINRLNKLFREQKVSPKSVTAEDVRELVEAFDAPAARRVEASIKAKIKAQAKFDEANKNVLMKVIKGEQPAPEDIHIFVDDIAKLSPGNIGKVMDKLSKPEQDSLRRSGLDWMLQKAGSADEGVQRTSAQTGGMALWNPDQMHKMLTNGVQRSKLEALIGKDIVADYARMNKVLGNAAILRQTSEGAGSRVVLTTGASGVPTPLVVSPGIPRWLGRKMLGIIHTSPSGTTLLRRWLQSPDKQAAEEAFQKIFFTSIATRSGLASASDESSKDPKFAAWLQEAMAGNEGQEALQQQE